VVFEDESLFLDALFFKSTVIYESLQVLLLKRTLSSLYSSSHY